MKKKFNITGTCIPERHYMVNIDNKLKAIMAMIGEGDYFTINRPRQYGKTTTMFLLEKELEKTEYIDISISFEGIGDAVFENEESFSQAFLELLAEESENDNEQISNYILNQKSRITDLKKLSRFITNLCLYAKREIVLMIDEVDKSSNNQLFLSFIGMLRNKFLRRNAGKDQTFLSVILAGVHDVKNLRLKLHPGEEPKFNSPWNIAVDFNVDLSFDPQETATMLRDYSEAENVQMDIEDISGQIYYYTSGYPFLVSYLCKIFAEEIIPFKKNNKWENTDTEKAVSILLGKQNTNFESLIGNIENNTDLREFTRRIIMNGDNISFVFTNPIISTGTVYGVFANDNGRCKIHNRIYEQLLYDYLMMGTLSEKNVDKASMYNFRENFIDNSGFLYMEKILLKFQEFMKEQYSNIDNPFLERNGRLIFLAFLKPIINGSGFDFKEVQVSEEKRLDIVITFYNKKYIVELKIWRGEKYHQKGLDQLCDYLERQNQDKGFLVIFDSKGKKEWKQESIDLNEKEIFAIWV
ncbi:MAG: AAA family ATPase [Bacteroidetes bacterium]|nr:MAG: AAA family ATPase [Bacteroidota bacterium]